MIAFESRWGRHRMLQVAAAAALAVSYLLVRLGPRAGWLLAALSGVGLAVALPLLGHAAGNAGRMAVHTVHLLGAGLWIGTLAALWVVARIESCRGGSELAAPALFRQFSIVALSGAVVVLVAGLVASALYVETLSSLWTTGYGRALMLKVALVAGIGVCGFVNWRRFGEPGERSTIPPTVPLEVALACAVAFATSVLTELEH